MQRHRKVFLLCGALCAIAAASVGAAPLELVPPKGQAFKLRTETLQFIGEERLAVMTATSLFESNLKGGWRLARKRPWRECFLWTSGSMVAMDSDSIVELDTRRWVLRRRFNDRDVSLQRVFAVGDEGLLGGLRVGGQPTLGLLSADAPPLYLREFARGDSGFRVTEAAMDAQRRLFFCSDDGSSAGGESVHARTFPDGREVPLAPELTSHCQDLISLKAGILIANRALDEKASVHTVITRLDEALRVAWRVELPVSQLALSADGSTLAALHALPGEPATLQLLSMADGHSSMPLAVGASASTLAITPSGKQVAIGYDDGAVRVWAVK